MNYETPHAQKMFALFQSPAQMQSPYQQLFLLQNRVPVDSTQQPAVKKIKKQISVPKPPVLVKNSIPKHGGQSVSQQELPSLRPSPVQTYQSMIELIRQNQDLKNELLELDKDILNYKNLLEIRSRG